MAWLSWLCGDTCRPRLKKVAVGWTKQKDVPLRGMFSEIHVPNMMTKIIEKFTLFGMLYPETQPWNGWTFLAFCKSSNLLTCHY